MNVWLLGMYVILVVGRVMLVLLQSAYSLYQRWVLAYSAVFTFLVLFPFMICWTILGTLWFISIAQTSSVTCVLSTQLPEAERSWLIVMWLAVSYVIILVLMIATCAVVSITIRERRLQQQVQVGDLMHPFAAQGGERRLSEEELRLLDRHVIPFHTGSSHKTCTICYEDFEVPPTQELEKVMRLPECAHVFHYKCIRDWLVIRAICPYCKGSVAHALGL